LRGTKWADGAIAWLNCAGNDLQQANLTAILSSGFASGRGYFVTPANLAQAAVVFAVRQLIKHTWINHNDQFLQPSAPLPNAFTNDCLIWMLFHGKNLTASADGLEWNGKQWSIVNHFIPFTEAEVGAPDRFESDFMVRYLAGEIAESVMPDTQAVISAKAGRGISVKQGALNRGMDSRLRGNDKKTSGALKLSPEAQAVMNAGRALWQAYFAETAPHHVRDELKLNRADVGWYQIRNALKQRERAGDSAPVDFSAFEAAYKALTEKLVPQVYELGFLKP
jgi:hypothetical protein